MGVIRRLAVRDAAAFRDLRLKGLKECPEYFTSDYDFETKQPLAWFERALAEEYAFGYFEGDVLLGMTVIRVNTHKPKILHRAYAWGVYVAREARGRGIAKALMEALLAAMPPEVELVQLGVSATNPAAKRLYEKLGFTAYGFEERSLKIDGRYVDEVLMVKYLR